MSQGITIELDDNELRKAIADIKAHEVKKIRSVGNAIEITVRNIERKAKKLVPVLSGRLRSSINPQMTPNRLSGRVYTNVEYASYVEHGTSKQRKQPFLRPAALLEQAAYKVRVTKALQ